MRNDKDSLIVKLTFELTIDVVEFAEQLTALKKIRYVFSNFQKWYFNWCEYQSG